MGLGTIFGLPWKEIAAALGAIAALYAAYRGKKSGAFEGVSDWFKASLGRGGQISDQMDEIEAQDEAMKKQREERNNPQKK